MGAGTSKASKARAGISTTQEIARVYGEPGSLYARCGGIFGVSSFVDRLMDRWMVDKTLNDNKLVARWHESAQRPGFKFLVVQLLCSMIGGPQQYTGRPMDVSHKHLNISEAEWAQFIHIFHDVCGEFSLPGDDIEALESLLVTMKEDCVLQPGERPWPEPQPAPLPKSGAYALAGGVYPIALFVDRLVDALLSDERIDIPVDGSKRNEASLKYLTTEVRWGARV